MIEYDKLENLSLFISRVIAFAIDNLIVSIFLFFAYLNIKSFFNYNYLLIFILILLYEFYFFILEMIFSRTPGKFLMGLKIFIKKKDEFPISSIKTFVFNIFEILIRNLTRVLIFIPPLFFWNELLIIIFNKTKTIRDLITSTEVQFCKNSILKYFENDFFNKSETSEV